MPALRKRVAVRPPKTIRQGAKGAPVGKLQTLLNRHGAKLKVDHDFGPTTAHEVERFQRTKGLGVDGIVGRKTWTALEPKPTSAAPNKKAGKHRPIARAVAKTRVKIVKLRHAVKPSPAAKRAMVVAFCKWGVAHQAEIHYAEIRPIPQVTPGQLPSLPLTTDCSGWATMACQYAGLNDPNGTKFNNGKSRPSYTGSLLTYGHKHAPAVVADIGVYGRSPGHHAVVAIESGTDPMCVSHGSEHGPLLIRASVEQSYQPKPLTWLDSGVLA